MFKEIVVATDGSTHATRAVDTAADIAVKYGANLTIVTVLPSALTLQELEGMPQVKGFSQDVKDDIAHFRKALASAASHVPTSVVSIPAPHSAIAAVGEQILDDAEKRSRQKGVAKVFRNANTGHPVEEIVRVAKKAKADLIVMGTRGLSDIQGVFMGSVSHKVIHLVDCACLTVK